MSDVRDPPLNYERNEDLFIITYVYVIFGSITLFLNIPLAIYLIKTTSRNQKELIVIIALSLSDTVCAAQFLAMGIYRFAVWFHEVYFISQAACNRKIIVASYIVCIQMDNFFSLVISLDRLYAVLFPVRYNKSGTGYTVLLVATPIIASILGYVIHLIVITILPPVYIDQICFNFLSVLTGFRNYMSLQRIMCVLIPTLIYFFIYIRMKLKFQKIGNQTSGLSKGMRHLTKTVAYITTASFFFVLIPEIWLYFQLFGGIDASLYFSFILFKKIVTFFIHTIRHRELMKHFEKYLPKKLTNFIHNEKQSHSVGSRARTLNKEFSNQMVTTMK